MIATTDPAVGIEELGPGYVRYRRSDGARWEVKGTCDHRGDCIIGAVIDGETVTVEGARARARAYSGPDVPVTPEFVGCCPLRGRWL